MKKKIGILTFHGAHNYGSMWQAYALQKYLSSQGYEVEDINLRIPAQKRAYCNPIAKPGFRTIQRMINNPLLFIDDTKKWYKFEKFLQNNIKLSKKEFSCWEELKIFLQTEPYDAIVCGGDQIWNITCEDFCEAYFLPIHFNHTKKISYSPSMGGFLKRIEQTQQLQQIKEWLTDFSYLSVREKQSAEYLFKLLNKEKHIQNIADPTLLLSLQDYQKFISKKPVIKGEYVLYYSPWYIQKAEHIAIELSNQLKLPIITTNGTNKTNSHIKKYNNTGPEEFLNILSHAKFVIGQSFHLLVFSLIFHKQFFIIDGNRDTRMQSLLKACGINGCAIDYDQPLIKLNTEKINFQQVDLVLKQIQRDGYNYIQSWNI